MVYGKLTRDIMGFIRKQMNAGLDAKIRRWIQESLGSFFRYTIDDNHQVKMESELDYWSAITYLLHRKIEIPDYISFYFEGRIMHITAWGLDPENLINTLNKHFQVFSNMDSLIITNHRSRIALEKIVIVRSGDRYKLIR